MHNLSELQNTAFQAIGPSRIAALSIMALMNEGTKNDKAAGIFDLSAKRVESACKMLETTLPDLLRVADHTLPGPVLDKQVTCLEALKPLINVVRKTEGRVTDLPGATREFSDHCLYILEPSVTDFLAGMTENLLETHKKRNGDRERDMLDAITDAESVGRNIQLIAFNASIEAARIGDMGKGFTVIAKEIRELSGKTQVLLHDIAGFLRA